MEAEVPESHWMSLHLLSRFLLAFFHVVVNNASFHLLSVLVDSVD